MEVGSGSFQKRREGYPEAWRVWSAWGDEKGGGGPSDCWIEEWRVFFGRLTNQEEMGVLG